MTVNENHYSGSDISEVLVSANEISSIVKHIAWRIKSDYGGKPLLIIGIVKGAFVFLADLVRALDMPVCITFIKASSYGSSDVSAGKLKIDYIDESIDYSSYHVLIVDEIIDTGRTFSELTTHYKKKNALSVELCAMFDKPCRRAVPVSVKYTGKVIPNKFVAGYGLDYAERYRELPFVGVVRTNDK